MADTEGPDLFGRLEALAARWEEERMRYRGGGGVYQGVHNALGTCAMELREALEYSRPQSKRTVVTFDRLVDVHTGKPVFLEVSDEDWPALIEWGRKGREAAERLRARRLRPEGIGKLRAFFAARGGVASASELASLLQQSRPRIQQWGSERGARILGGTLCFTLELATELATELAEELAEKAAETDGASAGDGAQPREPVRWFAAEMERKLALNDDRPGWEGENLDWLISRLGDELDELVEAVRDSKPLPEVLSEAADVGNFAMMIADAMRKQVIDD